MYGWITRTSHSYESLGVNNQWDDSTELNFDLLKMADTDLAKLSLQICVELYREYFGME